MLTTTEQKLEALRGWLKEQSLDAIIIPHEDEFLGEYIPEHNERLHWLTGFTGSAGAAVVTQDKAAIFVDGRYTVQVTKQVPNELFEYRHLIEEPSLEWVKQNLEKGSKVAIDPKMHSGNWLTNAQATFNEAMEPVVLPHNPIDELWHDRPTAQLSKTYLMPEEHSGQSSLAKRQQIGKVLSSQGVDAAVITSLDSICWLLNIRGSDVSRLPVLLSHAIIDSSGNLTYFIDESRIEEGFDQHVGAGVYIQDPSLLEAALSNLANKKVLVDPATSNAWFTLVLQNAGAHVVKASDPCAMPKAAKNSVEIKGMRDSHIKDGVAMVKFLSWLDKEVESGNLHSEGALSDRLHEFRKEESTLRDLSFDTISAAGSNAAMCHYNHLNEAESTNLSMDSLYLVDSGGQYLNGTTDITRTIAIGQPSDFMIRQFTLALKGHIGIARARFPQGTRGYQLDTLARQHLWAEGFDYDHGTGHGVGHYLSVHEGPASISKRQIDIPLVEGMVLSNEPGYYRADEFGIRIENLELVVAIPTQGDLKILGFESLTRCPIDVRNIDVKLLTRPELSWLNDYHQKVWDDLNPLVEGQVKEWLRNATQPLEHSLIQHS